jgi:hypothetical protein
VSLVRPLKTPAKRDSERDRDYSPCEFVFGNIVLEVPLDLVEKRLATFCFNSHPPLDIFVAFQLMTVNGSTDHSKNLIE